MGVSTLEVQTESWVGWRPDGKENVLEVEADNTRYLVMIKSRGMRKPGHEAHMGEMRGVYTVLVGKTAWKKPFARHRHRWEDSIKMDLWEVGKGRGLE